MDKLVLALELSVTRNGLLLSLKVVTVLTNAGRGRDELLLILDLHKR